MAGRTKTTKRVSGTRQKDKDGSRAKTDCDVVEQLIERAIEKIEQREVSVSELIKLMQLRKELDGDKVRKIEVRWVETFETEDAQ